ESTRGKEEEGVLFTTEHTEHTENGRRAGVSLILSPPVPATSPICCKQTERRKPYPVAAESPEASESPESPTHLLPLPHPRKAVLCVPCVLCGEKNDPCPFPCLAPPALFL